MFGIDFSEILVIFGIALVVLGPERLPKLANTIGRWIGRARAMARQFRDQLEAVTHTLHQGMDPGPDLSGRPGAQPGTGGAVPRPTANSSIDPRPAAGVRPMVGPPLPPMDLADTHPAGFHPYTPPAPAAPPTPAVATAASSEVSAPAQSPHATDEAGPASRAPHQSSLGPPDGAP
jgi:Tat protein translocase TatB subunit